MTFTKKTRFMLTLVTAAVILMSAVPVQTAAENGNVRHRLVRVFSVDPRSRTMRVENLLDLPSHDPGLIDSKKLYDVESRGEFETVNVSGNCLIYINSAKKNLNDIRPESFMIITVENNLVAKMTGISKISLQEQGIVSGILEENNPELGYITLYFPDGSGISPGLGTALSYYRTYSYLNADDVEVYKNGRPADLEDLNPGDSVFVKLDDEGIVVKISAADNFYPVYGKVKTKGNRMLQLEKEDGTTVQYRIPSNTPVFLDKRTASWSDIEEGDEVRILLQTSGNQVTIGEITVKKEEIQVDAVYKAEFRYYDRLDNSIVVSGLKQFKDGIWKTGVYGVKKLDINKKYSPDIPKGASGTVYLATGKNINGRDSVVLLSFARDELRTEISGDTIVNADPGRGRLTLMKRNSQIKYDETSIIVKGGKLLSPGQVKSMDEAYLVTGSQTDGSVKANIIWIRKQPEDTGLTLLRGRISKIEPYSSMTLGTYSEFSTPEWEYYNIPKTLTIDPSVTRVFDDGGRIDLAGFDDTGADSYKKRTVYVLVQDGRALLVSTAPFGDVVYKGRISELPDVQKDSFNHIVTPASSFIMKDGVRYNGSLAAWETVDEAEFSFLPNTVFVKNGKIADSSALETGDMVTVIKAETGDNAFIVMVESN